jgi:hypothetical protein
MLYFKDLDNALCSITLASLTQFTYLLRGLADIQHPKSALIRCKKHLYSLGSAKYYIRIFSLLGF